MNTNSCQLQWAVYKVVKNTIINKMNKEKFGNLGREMVIQKQKSISFNDIVEIV